MIGAKTIITGILKREREREGGVNRHGYLLLYTYMYGSVKVFRVMNEYVYVCIVLSKQHS